MSLSPRTCGVRCAHAVAASPYTTENSSVPTGVGGLDDVRRDIGNVVVAQAATECRHGVLAVGDLSSGKAFRGSVKGSWQYGAAEGLGLERKACSPA
jgi:hypothetical protein